MQNKKIQGATMTNHWAEQYKVRVREHQKVQAKHLIVKSLIVLFLKIKHIKQANFQKIYTEFPSVGGRLCDVYHENYKDKYAYAYEVQAGLNKAYKNKTREDYKDFNVYGINNADVIIVDLDNLSDDIEELKKQVWELVV